MTLNKTGLSSILGFAGSAASAMKTNAQKLLGKGRLRHLMLGVSLAISAAAPASSTLLFQPVGRGTEAFAFNGATMSQPLAINVYALNRPTVYFIFVGPSWMQNGVSTSVLSSMV